MNSANDDKDTSARIKPVFRELPSPRVRTDAEAIRETKPPKQPKPLDPASDTYLDELRMEGDGCPNVG